MCMYMMCVLLARFGLMFMYNSLGKVTSYQVAVGVAAATSRTRTRPDQTNNKSFH